MSDTLAVCEASPVAAAPSTTPVWRQLPNAFSLLLLLLLSANYFSTFADLDYMWQIRTGALLVQAGQLRIPESFSYTIAGQYTPDFEWLYEVSLWGVWTVFGYGGLKLLKTILVVGPLLLLARRLHEEGIGWHGIVVAFLLAVAVLLPAWNLRPLFCTTIGLLLLTGWLHDHCTGRRPLSAWLPLVMLLWANLHPGVIIGQGLLAGAIAWEWLNRSLQVNRPLEKAACLRLTTLGGMGLLATFLSPDPVERLLYPFRPELADPIMRAFTEMQPLYTFVWRAPFTSGLTYVVAALVGLTVLLRFREYRLWELMLLGGLAVLANVAFRSVQDWLLLMLALGLPHLAALLRQAAHARQHARRGAALVWVPAWTWPVFDRLLELDWAARRLLRGRLMCFQWFWPTAAAGVLAVLSLFPPVSRHMPRQQAPEWPVAALDRIEALGLSGRFFSSPDFGAYLGWRLGERGTCYVDTRGFFYPPELLRDSLLLPQMVPGWEERLERVLALGSDWFLLETTGARGQLWEHVRGHIDTPLYRDEHCVLLTAEQVRTWYRGPREPTPRNGGVDNHVNQ